MSRIIELTVSIEMSEDIPKEQNANIVENVLEAIVNHVDCSEEGIAGDDFEGYTTHIEVSHDDFVQQWGVVGGMETV